MAHFSKINENNIVTQVITNVPDEHITTGQDFINNTFNLSGAWLHTEPNAMYGYITTQVPVYSASIPNDNGDMHSVTGHLQGIEKYDRYLSAGIVIGTFNKTTNTPAFRKNYGVPGHTYHEGYDAFILPNHSGHASWVINPDRGIYEPPVTHPEVSDQIYIWNEQIVNWTYVMPLSTLKMYFLSGGPAGGNKEVDLWPLVGWYNTVSATL